MATPFEICHENIIDRPINRSYFAHLKKGLGASANDIEQNIKKPKLADGVYLKPEKLKKLDKLVMFGLHIKKKESECVNHPTSLGKRLWDNFRL
jgi:hypothetical protein